MSNTDPTIASLATPSMEERLIATYGLTAMDVEAYKEEMDKSRPYWLDDEEPPFIPEGEAEDSYLDAYHETCFDTFSEPDFG